MSAGFISAPEASRFSNRLVFFWAGALLFFAPIVRGGRREVALAALLALGLLLLATLLASQGARGFPHLRRNGTDGVTRRPAFVTWRGILIGVLVSSPIWIGLLQLIPLDADLWSALAGRSAYLPALVIAGIQPPESLPLSLTPAATWSSLWSALPLSAIFLAALALDERSIERLFGILVFAGLLQALVAIAQFAGGPNSVFYFDGLVGGTFVGTFTNRNHLADLYAMLIPIWFYFLVRQQKSARSSQEPSTWLERPALRPLWLFLGFGFLVIVLSTQSRGGLFATTTVVMLSTVVYLLGMRSEMGLRQRIVIFGLLALFALAALISVGLEGVASRLQRSALEADAEVRNAYAVTTFEAARAFWPWGSGLGSFEAVFPRFQELQSLGFVPHAHNDYPQLLLELGAPAVVVALSLAALVVAQVVRLVKRYRRTRAVSGALALRLLAGLGLLAMLMHSWVEFNMHVPALALIAAFLAGTFLRPLEKTSDG